MFKTHRALPACLLAMSVSAVAPACASQGRYYGYPSQRDPRSIERLAYDNGYRDGIERGERDARDRRNFRVDRDGDYRNADSGYRGYGDRNAYRRLFRDGYEAGYAEGYNRVARYDRSNVYGSGAAQTGYRDGYEAGVQDARDREVNDFRRPKRYREGDHDYDSRYGSRDQYKLDYRAAFQQGYEQGYRGSRR